MDCTQQCPRDSISAQNVLNVLLLSIPLDEFAIGFHRMASALERDDLLVVVGRLTDIGFRS